MLEFYYLLYIINIIASWCFRIKQLYFITYFNYLENKIIRPTTYSGTQTQNL